MNYSFNLPALDLSGKALKDPSDDSDLTLGRILANSLVSQAKGDAMKYLDWGRRMYAGDPVNLDRSDVKTLQEFINTSEQLTVLAKGQLLDILDKKD